MVDDSVLELARTAGLLVGETTDTFVSLYQNGHFATLHQPEVRFYILAFVTTGVGITGRFTWRADLPLPEGCVIVGSGAVEVGSFRAEVKRDGWPIGLRAEELEAAYALLDEEAAV